MKIEIISEDSAVTKDKKASLVIVKVNDQLIPYKATNTIKKLVEDMGKLSIPFQQTAQVLIKATDEIIVNALSTPIPNFLKVTDQNSGSLNTIQREDIVRCVYLEKDLDGNPNPDLKLGDEYRVISINKMNGKIINYEIMNDLKKDSWRISVYPNEIQLVRKFVPPPPRLPADKVIEIQKGKTDQELAQLE